MKYNIEQILTSLELNREDKYKFINFLKDLDERDKDLDSIHNEAIRLLNLKDKELETKIKDIVDNYATKEYVNNLIINTLNTPV